MLYIAARKGGALKAAGQGLNDSEQAEFLALLNSMIDGWKIENLLIQYWIRKLFTLTLFKKDYSVGVGGDFDMDRPEKIYRAGYLFNAGTTYEAELPIKVLQDYTEYAAEVVKNVGSSLPLVLYYQATYPLGTATFWPVPNQDNVPIVIYNRGVMQEFQSVDDTVYMPNGWREMLQYNLAMRIHENAPYNKEPMDASVPAMADFYKQRVKNMQITPILTTPDPAATNTHGKWFGGLAKAWTPYSD
jgi:hypothetical protein